MRLCSVHLLALSNSSWVSSTNVWRSLYFFFPDITFTLSVKLWLKSYLLRPSVENWCQHTHTHAHTRWKERLIFSSNYTDYFHSDTVHTNCWPKEKGISNIFSVMWQFDMSVIPISISIPAKALKCATMSSFKCRISICKSTICSVIC